VGSESDVKAYVEAFAGRIEADEIITVHPAPTLKGRLRSVELLAR
jgi:hypothetical protein